jgi:drug/metabolite transporter (DMT)-like permease
MSSNVRGMLALTFAMAMFVISDVFCKLGTETMPSSEVIALRGIFSLLLACIPFLVWGGLSQDFDTLRTSGKSTPFLHRIGGEMGAALTFIPALAVLPLSTAVSMTQTTPLVMTAAGAIFLGEKVGARRWAATCIGFLGVLFIMKPWREGFTWWTVLPLGCVMCVAYRDLVTRRMGNAVSARLLTLGTAAGVTVAGSLMGLFQRGWVLPPISATLGLFFAAVCIVAAYWATITAVRSAPLSTIAPFRYTIIPMSFFASHAVWADVPDRWTILGIAIIAGAGLYTFFRERRLAAEAVRGERAAA